MASPAPHPQAHLQRSASLDPEPQANGAYLDKLKSHKDNVLAALAGNVGSPRLTNCLDLCIAAENARRPGLNLRHFDSVDDFENHVSSMRFQQRRERAALRIADDHHLAVDVRGDPEEGLSMVAVDTTNGGYSTEFSDLVNSVGAKGLYLASCAQQSVNDCATFSTSFALKMHAHSDLFEGWHNALAQAGELDFVSSGDLAQGRHGSCQYICDARALLPLDFYKHTNSRRCLEAVLSARPDVPEADRSAIVSRMDQYRIKRQSGSKEREFSNSIERKQVALVDRAIDHVRSTSAEDLAAQLAYVRPEVAPRPLFELSDDEERIVDETPCQSDDDMY